MARLSTGLQFAIRFRARHNEHAHRFANAHFNLTLLARVLAEHKFATSVLRASPLTSNFTELCALAKTKQSPRS